MCSKGLHHIAPKSFQPCFAKTNQDAIHLPLLEQPSLEFPATVTPL